MEFWIWAVGHKAHTEKCNNNYLIVRKSCFHFLDELPTSFRNYCVYLLTYYICVFMCVSVHRYTCNLVDQQMGTIKTQILNFSYNIVASTHNRIKVALELLYLTHNLREFCIGENRKPTPPPSSLAAKNIPNRSRAENKIHAGYWHFVETRTFPNIIIFQLRMRVVPVCGLPIGSGSS